MARCIGVLALQGDFREHALSLERCGACAREIRSLQDLDGIEGLVLPGVRAQSWAGFLLKRGLWILCGHCASQDCLCSAHVPE